MNALKQQMSSCSKYTTYVSHTTSRFCISIQSPSPILPGPLPQMSLSPFVPLKLVGAGLAVVYATELAEVVRWAQKASTASRNAATARRGTLPCLTYLTTFDAGGAAIEVGVGDEAATGALFRNFFSGMS